MKTADDFVQAYKNVRRECERFALFVARDRELAADYLQEALTAAFAALRRIDDAGALKSYVMRAVLRQHRRSSSRAQKIELADMDLLRCPAYASAEETTDAQLVRDAIANLPDDQRIPLVLAEIEGWPLADIAAELGLGLSAVKMRIKRGRDTVIEQLREQPVTKDNVDHE